MTDHSATQDSNAFMTGFTVGLFAGAAGYYLFGTPQGAKLRKQLAQEWEQAKVQLAKDGVITQPDISLRDFLYDIFHKTVNSAPQPSAQHVLVAEASRSSKKPAKKKETTRRFRGV